MRQAMEQMRAEAEVRRSAVTDAIAKKTELREQTRSSAAAKQYVFLSWRAGSVR
jgi:hypothetical protein